LETTEILRKTITASINALPAHLAHDDSEGACNTGCAFQNDPVSFCAEHPNDPDGN